jgi:predicted benzoate:H+ symporter BenE
VVGFAGVVVTAGLPDTTGSVALPTMALPPFDFSPTSLLALGIPLLILTAGVGNLQALAILGSKGFKGRNNVYALVAGTASVVNALGGGHPAAIGGSTIAISASTSAGPKESRFWAIVISSVPTMVVALAAVSVIAVVQDLPLPYTLTVGAQVMSLAFKVLVKNVSWAHEIQRNHPIRRSRSTFAFCRDADGILVIDCWSCSRWRYGIGTVDTLLETLPSNGVTH